MTTPAQFRIANSFPKALDKLKAQEQKAAKITVFDLQQDPAAPGLRFHRVAGSKDPHFWSVRVNNDIRVIVHKTDDSFLICYVGHHDDAYKWAERRRIETHPNTGAVQIVEVRELVEEIAAPFFTKMDAPVYGVADTPDQSYLPGPFSKLPVQALLDVGVPEDWVVDIREASEDGFLDIAERLPAEASEALLDYVSTGTLPQPAPVIPGTDPFEHPDAQRRFRVMENME